MNPHPQVKPLHLHTHEKNALKRACHFQGGEQKSCGSKNEEYEDKKGEIEKKFQADH